MDEGDLAFCFFGYLLLLLLVLMMAMMMLLVLTSSWLVVCTRYYTPVSACSLEPVRGISFISKGVYTSRRLSGGITSIFAS